MITLSTELAHIRGIGQRFLSYLAKLNILTVKDLLWHFPTRYEDFSSVIPIRNLDAGETATIQGIIKAISSRRTWRRNIVIVEAVIADATGTMKAVWFNQTYLERVLRPGQRVNLAGRVIAGERELYLSNPSYEIVRGGPGIKHTGGLIPIYPETRGLTSRGLRYLIQPLLNIASSTPEWIPKEILARERLPELSEALRMAHMPKTLAEAERAKERFSFEELFLLQLNNAKLRSELARANAPPISMSQETVRYILAQLPFTLTPSQKRSLDELLADIAKPHPMNRLLQGDVGSGKTVIAAIGALAAAISGAQATFMAPTEILARQHYRTFQSVFGAMLSSRRLSVGLITSTEARIFYGDALEQKIPARRFLKEAAEGKISILIGTHALLEKRLAFHRLALVIIDEQHRFGVEQRAALVRGGSTLPHFLSMSATPIPRTLSLTLFGDLDLSIIDELPAGRKEIITKVVDPVNRAKAYQFIHDQIRKGRQAFVVCPRIEPSKPAPDAPVRETSGAIPFLSRHEAMQLEVKAVKEEFERLKKSVFRDLRVGMLHGKMKGGEKGSVMKNFAEGRIDILVSTSVVEVGVDVANATIMVIEGADRFGLAQLYQFRGRVGRGTLQSFCLLFTESERASAQERFRAFLAAKNGFELAELDLKLRGPGQFLGEKQTGLPDLAMRSLSNLELIKAARDSAAAVLGEDPDLRRFPLLKAQLAAFTKSVHFE